MLLVGGADLMDGTPIFDIKPYVPYADCHPEALSGFAPDAGCTLTVEFPPSLEARVPAEKRAALRGVLANDPRPRYQHDPERVYGLRFGEQNVKFTVDGDRLTVRDVGKGKRGPENREKLGCPASRTDRKMSSEEEAVHSPFPAKREEARSMELPKRKPLRLPNYDYSAPGAYFVTICTR